MELSLFETYRKKKLTRHLAAWLFEIAVFYAAVCTPLSRMILSDVLLLDTVLPIFLDVLLLGLNYLFYWIAFAFLLYTLLRFEERHCVPMLAVYAGAVVFRYLANQIADFCMIGFPPINDFFKLYLPYCLLDILLDLVQMGIAFWLASLLKRRVKDANGLIRRELPLEKLSDLGKTVTRCALVLAAVPAALRLISRIIYDLWLGAPADLADLLWMITSYVSDIACVLIGYVVIVLLLNRFFLREEKARMEYDQAHLLDSPDLPEN